MEIFIPKSWHEISVEKYKELLSVKGEDYSSSFSFKLEILAVLNDTSVDDDIFQDLDINEITEYLDKIKWIFGAPNGLKNTIDNFKLKDVKKLTLGEFIDIDYQLKDVNQNLDIICAILYKKYKIDEWGNSIEEPYIYNLEDRRLDFSKISITSVIGIIKYFLDFKEVILNTYSIIFTSPDDLEELEDTTNLSEEEIEEINREIEIEKSKSKWAWSKLIYDICDGDLTKADAVTNLPLTYILNTLVMKKELDIK